MNGSRSGPGDVGVDSRRLGIRQSARAQAAGSPSEPSVTSGLRERLVPDPTSRDRSGSILRVTDEELVQLARDGDAQAFEQLADSHKHAVYRAALAALRVPGRGGGAGCLRPVLAVASPVPWRLIVPYVAVDHCVAAGVVEETKCRGVVEKTGDSGARVQHAVRRAQPG